MTKDKARTRGIETVGCGIKVKCAEFLRSPWRNCIHPRRAGDAHRRPAAARFVHACTPKCVGIDSNGISRSQEPRCPPAVSFDVFFLWPGLFHCHSGEPETRVRINLRKCCPILIWSKANRQSSFTLCWNLIFYLTFREIIFCEN